MSLGTFYKDNLNPPKEIHYERLFEWNIKLLTHSYSFWINYSVFACIWIIYFLSLIPFSNCWHKAESSHIRLSCTLPGHFAQILVILYLASQTACKQKLTLFKTTCISLLFLLHGVLVIFYKLTLRLIYMKIKTHCHCKYNCMYNTCNNGKSSYM